MNDAVQKTVQQTLPAKFGLIDTLNYTDRVMSMLKTSASMGRSTGARVRRGGDDRQTKQAAHLSRAAQRATAPGLGCRGAR